LFVVGPVVLVVVCLLSLALLQAEVWVVVVVVVCVKPAFPLGGVTGDVVVVVPQSLVLAAWAAGKNPPTAVNAAKVVATVKFFSAMGCSFRFERRLNPARPG
jgi:hypothetical protein